MVHCLIRVVKIFVAMCAHGIGAVWMDLLGKWSWIQMLSIPETRASNAIRWICGMPSAKTQNTKVQSHTSHSRSSNFNILAIWIRKKHIFEKTCWMINDYCHHPKDNCCIPDLPSSKREKVGSKSFGHVVVAPPKRQPSIFLTQVFLALRLLLDTLHQAADLSDHRIRFPKNHRNCDLSKVKVQYLLGVRNPILWIVVCLRSRVGSSPRIGPSKEGWNKEHTIFLRPFPGTSVNRTMMLEASCWTVCKVPIYQSPVKLGCSLLLLPIRSLSQRKSSEKINGAMSSSKRRATSRACGWNQFLFVGCSSGPPSPVKSDPTQTGWKGKSCLY